MTERFLHRVAPVEKLGEESRNPDIHYLYYIINSFYIFIVRRRERPAMMDFLSTWYPWITVGHVVSMVAWMAGLFYLPRLYVYHVEQVVTGSPTDLMFQTMERRLLKGIIGPASIATWVFGLCLMFTPGIVDWSMVWPWTKAASVLAMTGFQCWLGVRRKHFVAGSNTVTGRQYRFMNEMPTILLVVIVASVIVKF